MGSVEAPARTSPAVSITSESLALCAKKRVMAGRALKRCAWLRVRCDRYLQRRLPLKTSSACRYSPLPGPTPRSLCGTEPKSACITFSLPLPGASGSLSLPRAVLPAAVPTMRSCAEFIVHASQAEPQSSRCGRDRHSTKRDAQAWLRWWRPNPIVAMQTGTGGWGRTTLGSLRPSALDY